MPPIVSVIGKKNSGKTTLVVALVAELGRRGYGVMTVKHGHGFDLDRPGTDSWRHRHEGGASRVVMVAPHEVGVTGSWGPGGEPSLRDIVERFLWDADLVVAEGFKREDVPRIEVYRSAVHPEPIYDPAHPEEAERYLAMVSDAPIDVPFPLLRSDDPARVWRLADLVEERVLGRGAVRRGAL